MGPPQVKQAAELAIPRLYLLVSDHTVLTINRLNPPRSLGLSVFELAKSFLSGSQHIGAAHAPAISVDKAEMSEASRAAHLAGQA